MAHNQEEAFTEILGEKLFRSWSRENELYWMLFRTAMPGHWKYEDVLEFNSIVGSFIIYFDHSRDADARLFCIRVIDRCRDFKAAKVSKFAIDDEKIIVLSADSDRLKSKVRSVCHEMGFKLYGFRAKGAEVSDIEKMLAKKWDTYLKALAKTYGEPGDPYPMPSDL